MFSGISEIIADKRRIDDLEKQIEILEKQIEILKFKIREARSLACILRNLTPTENLPLGIDPILDEWEDKIP